MAKVSRLPFDAVLLMCVLVLLAFSVIMVGSASLDVADARYGSPLHILLRWCFYIPVGLLVMWAVASVSPLWWEALAIPLLMAGFGVLVALLLLGNEINGATRWFSIFGMSMQPIELIKPIFILYLAYYLSRFPDRLRSFANGVTPMLVMLFLLVVLLLLQPDFGNAALLLGVTFCLWFVGGVPGRHLMAMLVVATPIVVVVLLAAPYRMQRMTAFLDPWADRFGSGYQLVQSEIAFGVGGLTGAGLGQGVQKLFYLPESFTDFIAAVIGEELGLLGMLVLIGVFSLMFWRGMRIAMQAEKQFSRLLALGCTLLLAASFMINLGAAMGIFPTKGMPMPFISYGGSALIGSCILVGLLFSVQRHEEGNIKKERRRSQKHKQGVDVADGVTA